MKRRFVNAIRALQTITAVLIFAPRKALTATAGRMIDQVQLNIYASDFRSRSWGLKNSFSSPSPLYQSPYFPRCYKSSDPEGKQDLEVIKDQEKIRLKELEDIQE